jgi:predicted TPR repeat methyltransferase
MADTPVDYFSSMYADDVDPWGFDRRWYEQRKYALTLAALPHRRFRVALEAGCANGALTELLAARCDHITAFDCEPSAVERVRRRLEPHGHVDVAHARFPDWWPPGGGDLVVWSEVAYYLGADSADRAVAGLEAWLDSAVFLRRVTTAVDESFELGVWRRVEHA